VYYVVYGMCGGETIGKNITMVEDKVVELVL
jgi:hypothetical protein